MCALVASTVVCVVKIDGHTVGKIVVITGAAVSKCALLLLRYFYKSTLAGAGIGTNESRSTGHNAKKVIDKHAVYLRRRDNIAGVIKKVRRRTVTRFHHIKSTAIRGVAQVTLGVAIGTLISIGTITAAI